MYQTYGLVGPYGVYNIDPHPFQTNAAIAANPWTEANTPCPTGLSGANCPAAIHAQTWSDDVNNSNSGAFPSAHTIAATTSALTYAMMMPEAWQDLMHAAQQFGFSRNVIAVHHPTDIIGGRIVSLHPMTGAPAQSVCGQPGTPRRTAARRPAAV